MSLYSLDGLHIRDLVTDLDGIMDPRGVAMDSSGRLIVACWDESKVICFK